MTQVATGNRPANGHGYQQQPQNNQQRQPNQQQQDPVALLNQILDSTSAKVKVVKEVLLQRVPQIEDLLPDNMKGQGERLIQRAMLTMGGKADLSEVTPTSFIKCVLQAAELGLAIDGRLAHAVVYNNKKKGPNGQDIWEKEAQLQVDYKGLIAVARRTNTIADAYARLVYDGDEFMISEEDGQCHLHHVPVLDESQRGGLIGAYAIIKLPTGTWRYEWMFNSEIDSIRGRSKSWKGGQGFGPWKTDDGEMRKKTCIKRALKTYSDDPGVVRALQLDDQDYSDDDQPQEKQQSSLPTAGRKSFAKKPAYVPQDQPPVLAQESSFDEHAQPEPTEQTGMSDGDEKQDFINSTAQAIAESESEMAVALVANQIDNQESWIGKDAAEQLRNAVRLKCTENEWNSPWANKGNGNGKKK